MGMIGQAGDRREDDVAGVCGNINTLCMDMERPGRRMCRVCEQDVPP